MKKLLSMVLATYIIGSSALAATPLGTGTYQRQMEALQRGVIARDAKTGGIFISWRNLASEDVLYNVYRNNIKLNTEPLNVSNYTDENGTLNDTYYVTAVDKGGKEIEKSENVTPFKEYLKIPLDRPDDEENYIGELATYTAQKAGIGDLDGDGNYEFVVVWYPSNAKDNSQDGYTSPVYVDGYKMNGTKLWRINLGPNIRAGEHYTPTVVYDFDGDGVAEIALKTGDGTVDGEGNIIGDENAFHTDNRGHIIKGSEYLTIFDGKSGKELDTIDYLPARGLVSDWGDSGGNRSERFLAGVAYVDGIHPSLITSRGYYTSRDGQVGQTGIVAYNFKDGKLQVNWEFKASIQNGENAKYVGQGNHSMVCADVDDDGFDEIIYGSMVVDHDGKGLYSTGRGHGDAIHVGYFKNEDRLQIVKANEDVNVVTSGYGFEYRYADDGEIIFAASGVKDNGRTIVADIDPTAAGPFINGAGGTGMWINKTGDEWEKMTTNTAPNAFPIWWDGDLLRELGEGYYKNVDGVSTNLGYKVAKYDWNNNTFNQLFNITGVLSGRRPLLQADIIGDWREELLLADIDGSCMRLYTTNEPTEYNIPTLMHDPKYRLDVATQPSGYSQPPWPGFYIGHVDFEIPEKGEFTYNTIELPEFEIISSTSLVLKIGSNKAIANGTSETIDSDLNVFPVIDKDRTLVPLRFISEKLEYTVDYEQTSNSVTLTKDNTTIKIEIGKEDYTVNNEKLKFDVAPTIINDRTFVPLRALSEIINMNVTWDDGYIGISSENDFDISDYKNMF